MKHETIQKLCSCGVLAAVICVLSPFSIPIGPVPVAFANLAIFLAVLSVWLARRGDLGWPFGVMALALSMCTYQAYAAVAIALSLLAVFREAA